jgi:hypothetical protein
MPTVHSKVEARKNDEKLKTRTMYAVCFSIFLSVLQHVIQLQAEPLLIRRLVNNNPVVTAQVMANTSGLIGILGLLVNQIGGKLSDALGRKYFYLVGPFTSFVCGLLVNSFSNSFSVVTICRVLRTLMNGFSSSVMCSASLSDVLEGKQLSIAHSYLGASVGLAVIFAPIVEGYILKKTNMSLQSPALALSTLGVIHSLFILYAIPETNASVLKHSDCKVSFLNALFNLDFASINPFSFMSIFREDPILETAQREKYKNLNPNINAALDNRRIIKRLVLVSTFQSFLEGKNVNDIVQVWQREHLKWDAFGMRDFTVTYGILCFLAGQFLTPTLLRNITGRNFTSLTNILNAFGFIMRGATEIPIIFWWCIVPMLPGVNGASASAVKSMATDRCIAAGVGRGELSAWLNNLRALVLAVAPVIYGNFYAFCVSNKIYPGITFTIAAIFGAIIPEILHQTLKISETKTLTREDKYMIIEGRKLASLQNMKKLMQTSSKKVE